MATNSNFSNSVFEAVKKIPCGCVVTYGDIAVMVNNPGSARAVGNVLHKNSQPYIIPCHRVVNAKGYLSKNFAFGGINAQKSLLEAENVEIDDNYKVINFK